MARARRARPVSLEDRLATDDPAVWTTLAERADVATLLAAGGVEARAALLDLGVVCPPAYDVAADVFEADPAPLAPLRGRALDTAVVDAVASIVDARRLAAAAQWVTTVGLDSPAYRQHADSALADRFGVGLAGSW